MMFHGMSGITENSAILIFLSVIAESLANLLSKEWGLSDPVVVRMPLIN